MNTTYYEFPYKKVLNYLSNNVSQEDLDALYSQYGIEPSEEYAEVEQLAEVISDEDIKNLGYQAELDFEDDDENFDYDYPDLQDIIEFLANLDADVIDELCTRYDTHDLEDVAIALTDTELENLGYVHHDDDECCVNELDFNYPNYEYSDELDYLEDVPADIQYIIVDSDEGLFAVNDEQDYNRFRESLDPILVEDCGIVDEYPNQIVFKIVPHKFEISEEVIINQELNPDIFDENHIMKPEVKEQIIAYVEGFVKEMADKDVNIDYNDIMLVGSNAGYLYKPESDIDIHLMSMQPLSPETSSLLFDAFDMYEAENPLFINKGKVELGIDDGYENIVNSARKYSLVDDTWIDDSDKLEHYTEDDLTTVSGYEDVVNEYAKQIDEFVDNDMFVQASALKAELRKNRSEDLATVGALSMGNVVFKELREMGAYDKLRNYIREKELEVGLGNE